MKRTRIKLCGMTRREDALAAAAAGADAIGFVFASRSPRCITPEQAALIRAALPPLVTVVALFMDDDVQRVRTVEEKLRPDLLQFHGVEEPAFCSAFDTPYMKTVGMASSPDLRALFDAHDQAVGFLLDGHAAGEAGGSGRRFDWSKVPRGLSRPLIVAGGLDPDNVGEAVRTARPWAVDVSSGIESTPGIKDLHKLRAFIRAVHAADAAADDKA